jgi:hypothetical protein
MCTIIITTSGMQDEPYADIVIVTLPDHNQKEVSVSESVSPYFKREESRMTVNPETIP